MRIGTRRRRTTPSGVGAKGGACVGVGNRPASDTDTGVEVGRGASGVASPIAVSGRTVEALVAVEETAATAAVDVALGVALACGVAIVAVVRSPRWQPPSQNSSVAIPINMTQRVALARVITCRTPSLSIRAS